MMKLCIVLLWSDTCYWCLISSATPELDYNCLFLTAVTKTLFLISAHSMSYSTRMISVVGPKDAHHDRL